jgi:uncharacterized protein YjbI with pentapeptide repeats
MSKEKQKRPSFLVNLIKRLRYTLFHFLNAIAETITSSVHIPDLAIGPIVASLITSATTLIIGFVTLSNIFSEQFLYRPLQIQDNNAVYNLELETYHQKVLTDYLDYTTKLMLDYPLHKLQKNHNLLRSLTQSTLAQIDGQRKRFLILFLKDSLLLTNYNSYLPSPLLEGANLSEAKLENLDIPSLNLKGANLSKINFSKSKLNQSNLSNTIATNGDFTNVDLRGVNFIESDLTNANFTNACYDQSTRFPDKFNPQKAKLRLIKTEEVCNFKAIEKDIKQIINPTISNK